MGAAALDQPIKHAIARLVPCAPAGLRRALERLGEAGWPAEAYRALIAGLRRPEAAKAIRHADLVSPEFVTTLAATPEPLLRVGIGRWMLDAPSRALMEECFFALERREGRERARLLATRWRAATDARALFKRVREDLMPEVAPPALPTTPRLRWFRSKAELRVAGARFRNCLADEVSYAAQGTSVYGEWLGEPAAAIEVARDLVFGWRLEQARVAGNQAVPEPTRSALSAELAALGVHIGRNGWTLIRAAEAAAEGRVRTDPLCEIVDELFGTVSD